MASIFSRLTWAAKWRIRQQQNDRRLLALAQQAARDEAAPVTRPVVVFNASTRLMGISQNAAFSLIASWSLRLAGTPVVHIICRSGLVPCVLGTNRDDVIAEPPCSDCIAQSRKAYTGAVVRYFGFTTDTVLKNWLDDMDVSQLMEVRYHDIPLGQMVLPSIRWILRRHTLPDDKPTRFLFRQYIRSAWSVAQQFGKLLEKVNPAAVVVFNGMFYPEAAVRWQAQQAGVRVITHEVALQPYSAFFTQGEATAYPIDIPDSFALSPEQEARMPR